MKPKIETTRFWAVEGLPSGKAHSLHSTRDSAEKTREWAEKNDPQGWYTELYVSEYSGKQLPAVLSL